MSKHNTPSPKRVAWFVTFLCCLALGVALLPTIRESLQETSVVLLPFFSFLPAAFFWIAHHEESAAASIRKLEERVEELERLAGTSRRLAS